MTLSGTSDTADLDSKPGLKWETHLFSPVMVRPRWTQDLPIDDLKAFALQGLAGEGVGNLEVTFLVEGLFNRVYRVHTDHKKQYVLRVSLLTDYHNKTACEAATLGYLKLKTSLPFPEVYASESSSSNLLGYEYTLEEFVSGTELSRRWNKLSFPQLSRVIRRLATFQAQLFHQHFHAVGGLRKAANGNFALGNMADIQFPSTNASKIQSTRAHFTRRTAGLTFCCC